MTAAHPSQPGYVPARLVAAASAHRGRHKAGRWSPFEERHVAMLQSEAGVLGAVHRGELTDSDMVLLENLDFELPCRKSDAHPSAVWAVWYVQRHICCNPPQPEHETPSFICGPCMDRHRRGPIKCPHCGAPCGDFNDIVIRTERIKP